MPRILKPGTRIQEQYRVGEIGERHRHRYEFNNDYRKILEEAGLVISGTSPDRHLVETIETCNDYFVAVQFHPEFKSRPNRPHPLFVGLVSHALKKQNGK